jgi:autotransporter-associated beta strand protein
LLSASTTLHLGPGAVFDETRGNGEEFGGLSGEGVYLAAASVANGVRIGTNNQNTTFAGTITAGAGGQSGATPAERALPQFRKLGTGTTTLTGSSSDFAAQVQIENGVLEVANLPDRGLASSVGLGNIVAGGADFSLGTGATPGTLRYLGPSASTNRSFTLGGPGAIDVADPTAELTLAATISGSRSLTKAGPGTLRLTAANTFSGGMNVSQGVVLVDNLSGSATGTGAVTVGAGGTLAGTGSIAGAVNVAGTVSPGQSLGQPPAPPGVSGLADLTVGAASFSPGGTFRLEVAGTLSDRLRVQGLLDLSSGADVLEIIGLPLDGTAYTIASYQSISGAFDHIIGLPPTHRVDYTAAGNTVRLAVVPEPSGALLGVVGVAALAFFARCRFRRT